MSRPSSVDSFAAKNRKTSHSMKKTGRQSRKVLRDRENEAGVEAGLRSLAKEQDVTNATPADFDTLR